MFNSDVALNELGFYFSYLKGGQIVFIKETSGYKTNLHIDKNTGKFILTGSVHWIDEQLIQAINNEVKSKYEYDSFGGLK